MMTSTRRASPSRVRRLVLPVAAAFVLLAPSAEGARGQVVPGALGAVGGLAAGAYTTMAIYVTEARFGNYLFSVDELVSVSPEIIPLVAMPVAGTWLGLESGTALGRAAGWGGAGLIGGAVVGAGVGHLVWESREGRWAGGIIGSAVGMITGMVLGARDGLDDDEDGGTAPITLSFSIPVEGF